MGADNNISSQTAAEAREYAESIVETLHEPLLVLNPDLTVKGVNPAFYKHFKADPDETLGRKIYDLGNGQWDIPALRKLLEDVLPDSKVFNDYEVIHEFEAIGRRIMLLNARRLNHSQLILLGIRDITEKKLADKEIADAREYAEAIVDTFHEPLIVLRPDLTVRSVNRAFSEHFGSDPRDTIDRRIYELGNGQWNIPALRTLLEDVLPDSKVFNDYEVIHDFEDIGERIMLLNARRLDHVQLILLGIRDITERERALANLRESEGKYRSLFDTIGEGFCVFEMIYDDSGDPVDYRFTEVNPAFERHTGLFDAVGKTVRELVPAHEKCWFEIYGRVAETGEPVRFEQRGEGMRRWFRVSAFKFGEPDSKTVAALFADITELKRAEESRLERERLATLIAGQEEERKRIARDLHDELGQQLTALRLKLESLADDAPASAPIREIAVLAKKIDDGVDFIAWELRPAALQDAGLIEALRRYVKEWSHYSGVKGTLVAPSNWPAAGEVVETALYRVVQEAMNNINKHADAQTAVVTLTQQGSSILLTIDDDGNGFDPDGVKKKRGLGLIGMQERIEMVGGTFEIESTPDSGTTIFAKFPTQPVPNPPPQ